MAFELNLLPDVKKEYLKSRRQRNLVMTIAILASVISGGIIVALLLTMGGLEVQKNILLGQIGDAGNPDANSYLGKIVAAQKSDKEDLNSVLTVQNNLAQIASLKEKQPAFSRLLYGSAETPGFLAQMNPADPVSILLQQATIGSAAGSTGLSTTGATGANLLELQGIAWNRSNPNASFDALNTYVATLKNATISYAKGANGKVVTENLFAKVVVSQQQLAQDSSLTDHKTLPVSFTIDATYNPAAFANSSTNISVKVPQKSSSDAITNAPKSVFGSSATTTNQGETK